MAMFASILLPTVRFWWISQESATTWNQSFGREKQKTEPEQNVEMCVCLCAVDGLFNRPRAKQNNKDARDTEHRNGVL